MAILYRTDGAWGSGLGTNLTAAQVDGNFWDIAQRLVDLENQVKATNTLTLTGNAANNETVTIGTRVYTWKATLTGAADEVKIGASASASLDNLIAAINGSAGAGTLYGTGTTAHSLVTAAPDAGDTMTVEAKASGEFGNTIVTAETMTNGSWTTSTLSGGIGIGADNIASIQVIGSQMTIYTQSGAVFGPFTLPIAIFHWRGNWLPAEDYFELDIVFVPFVGVYLVMKDHNSPDPFDPAFAVDGIPVYHKLFGVPGVSSMNWRGDFVGGETYFQNDVFFVPGQGSFVVLLDHTADMTFDPDAVTVGTLLPLYDNMQEPGGGTVTDYKESARAATTASITIATALNAGDVIDGVTLADGDRVLVKNQATGSQNGIYVAGATPARAPDFDEDTEVTAGTVVPVTEGTANGDKLFVLTTNDPIIVGTTSLSFSAVGGGGSIGSDSVTNESFVAGSSVSDALETLSDSDNITNGSGVAGAKVSDALDTLAGLIASGVVADFKASVRAATTANITISTALNNGDVIDGVTLATNDRVLVKNQATAADNGIYVVGVTPARSADFDTSGEVTAGTVIPVAEGTANGDKVFLLTTNDPITLGTTGLSFTSISGSGATAFTGLSDVPASYTSQAKKKVRVNTGETALEFVDDIESIIIALGDETTAITTGTKVTMRMPYAFHLTQIPRASLTTAQAANGGGGIFRVDIKEAGASIFSTLLTIDNTEKTSVTAATAAVLSDSDLADDAEMTFIIDQIGDGSAKGCKVNLVGYRNV